MPHIIDLGLLALVGVVDIHLPNGSLTVLCTGYLGVLPYSVELFCY